MDEQEVDEKEEDMVSYVQCTTSTCSRWRLVPKAMADRYEEDENFVCDIIEDCGCDAKIMVLGAGRMNRIKDVC